MKIHHVALNVNNLEGSIAFYELFGLQVVREFSKPEHGWKAVLMQLDDMHIELFEYDNQKENADDLSDLSIRGIRHVGFKVYDIDQKIQELRSKGIDVEDPKEGTTKPTVLYAFFKDPNGISLELYQLKG